MDTDTLAPLYATTHTNGPAGCTLRVPAFKIKVVGATHSDALDAARLALDEAILPRLKEKRSKRSKESLPTPDGADCASAIAPSPHVQVGLLMRFGNPGMILKQLQDELKDSWINIKRLEQGSPKARIDKISRIADVFGRRLVLAFAGEADTVTAAYRATTEPKGIGAIVCVPAFNLKAEGETVSEARAKAVSMLDDCILEHTRSQTELPAVDAGPGERLAPSPRVQVALLLCVANPGMNRADLQRALKSSWSRIRDMAEGDTDYRIDKIEQLANVYGMRLVMMFAPAD